MVVLDGLGDHGHPFGTLASHQLADLRREVDSHPSSAVREDRSQEGRVTCPGSLWKDLSGEMDVRSSKTGELCLRAEGRTEL